MNYELNVLVINCGSSSLKFRIIHMPSETELISGEAVRVGIKTNLPSSINYSIKGKNKTMQVPMPDHSAAFQEVTKLLKHVEKIGFDCIAHRYVHPGNYFHKTIKVDGHIIEKLKNTLCLAPIHNTVSLRLIETCARECPGINQYAVFDTVFHKTIPDEAASYALPANLVNKYHFRKTGFHGISHRYIMEETFKHFAGARDSLKIISCHLGSGGSSLCAIENGKSINNSMGFSPLEGLMMNTRSGDIDIGILLSIMSLNNISAGEVENMLNFKSGILGVFTESSDMRDIVKRYRDDAKARMVFEMYVRRVRKYIGYYNLLLKNTDVLVFTDTLGIEVPLIRKKACEGLECFGIMLDSKKNVQPQRGLADLSDSKSKVKILAIPTNEEIMIARETYKEFPNDTHYKPAN
ncbi:MAG: hypothetical protein A2252_00295 [Elusimicrobia bacterium RIFOXYA2_FULL_39_19]|nr:MAG: hypothetical protein A2252_00295 [Elusimicrobia bacterium RIFOXYA2_FULL_39_19]